MTAGRSGPAITYVVVWGPDSDRRRPGQDVRVVKAGRAGRRQRIVPFVGAGARVLFFGQRTPPALERAILAGFCAGGLARAFASPAEAVPFLPGGDGRRPGSGWTECYRYVDLASVLDVVFRARRAVLAGEV